MRKTSPGLLYAMIGASLAPCSQAAVLEGNPANYAVARCGTEAG